MRLTSLQKAKVILRVNFLALFFLIVSTPFYIREGFGALSEEFMEGVFLVIELFALIIIFKHYEEEMKKKEDEAYLLDARMKSKERELLSAFEYLGKVNVQVSMIKEIFEKTEVPASRNHLRQMYTELLRIVCNMTKEDQAILRIVNLRTGKTVSEQVENSPGKEAEDRPEMGNKELIEEFSEKKRKRIGSFCVLYSASENFYIKAFILVPCSNGGIESEERRFLEAIANQCEILFLLFNSVYYKK